MALTTNDINIKATFNLDGTPSIKVTDLTDYAGISVTPANVSGILTITNPAGTVVYENTDILSPDIAPGTSLESTTYTLPVDGNGDVLEGDYIILYSAKDSAGAPDPIVRSFTLTYTFDEPTVSIATDYDCLDVFLKSKDITDYSYNYEGTAITPTISRNHKLQFPVGSGLTQVNAATSIIQVEEFATGIHQIYIESTLTYALTANLEVVVTVEGQVDDLDVVCETALCDFYCALKELNSKYNQFKATNPAKAKEKLEYFQYGVSLVTMIRQAYACNKRADVTTYTEQLSAFLDCDCGCGDGSTPTIISNVTSILNSFSTWYSGTGAPATSLAQNGDFYVATDTQTFYKKEAGAWTEIFAVTDGNGILNGTSDPTSGIGNDGEFFINTSSNTLFGPKAAGTWPVGVSLVGPTGATGPAGPNGTTIVLPNDSAISSTTSSSYVNVAKLGAAHEASGLDLEFAKIGDGYDFYFFAHGDASLSSGRTRILIDNVEYVSSSFAAKGVGSIHMRIRSVASDSILITSTCTFGGIGGTATSTTYTAGSYSHFQNFYQVPIVASAFNVKFQYLSDGTNVVWCDMVSVEKLNIP